MPSVAYSPTLFNAPAGAGSGLSAALARRAQRTGFGFPRAWLLKQLRLRLAEQLYLGEEACLPGYRNSDGRFIALDDADDFDGPHFLLRLTYAIGGHQVFDHLVDLQLSILMGQYQLHVGGHVFDIPFLPSLDQARLTAAARWIIRNIDKSATLR